MQHNLMPGDIVLDKNKKGKVKERGATREGYYVIVRFSVYSTLTYWNDRIAVLKKVK